MLTKYKIEMQRYMDDLSEGVVSDTYEPEAAYRLLTRYAKAVQEITYQLDLKKEQLTIANGIVNGGQSALKCGEGIGRPLLKALADIETYRQVTIPAKMVSVSLKRGSAALSTGRFQEALEAWQTVLSVCPEDRAIHSGLIRMAEGAPTHKEAAARMHHTYRLDYLGSFGESKLKRPLAITTDWDSQGLIIADYDKNRIFHCNRDGSLWRELNVPVQYPIGIFRDDDELVWICDRGMARLTAIDRHYQVARTIPLEEVFQASESLCYPAHACRVGHHLYLIVMDEHHQRRRVVAVEDKPPYRWREVVPADRTGMLDGIEVIGEDLYLTDIEPGVVFKYVPKTNEWSRFVNKGPLPNAPRRCVAAGQFIFMTAGKTLTKYAQTGQEVFVADLARIIGSDDLQPLSLACIESEGRRFLYVSDVSPNACIYRFAI